MVRLSNLDWLALVGVIIGGLNWGLIGLFEYNLVAAIFGEGTLAARIVYTVVGVCAAWLVTLIVRLFIYDRPASGLPR